MRIVSVASRVSELAELLTPAERRVAHEVLSRPELVAFGTVAELAGAAEAGAATVVRLSTKLGYDGFTGLQDAVQAELGKRLRPAAQRIREPAPDDVIGRTLAMELENLHATLDQARHAGFETAVDHLVDPRRRIAILSGEASRGVATQFAGELASLRPDVALVNGNEVAVLRELALLSADDVIVAIDLRRYDRWTVEAVRWGREHDLAVIAMSDSALSPIAEDAVAAFTVVAGGAGPFDSHVGTLALLNAVVTACAAKLKLSAAARLDQLESAWQRAGALRDLG
jgi:DNA-binding MurR/RpiR family transcriptional regulator